MSRYVILLLLNLPFIIAAVLSALTQYKLGKSTKRKFYIQLVMWGLVVLALVLAEPIYNWLFSNNFTETESLSLFDVVLFTAVVMCFYLINRSRSRLDSLTKQVQDLHRALSIKASGK